MPDLTRFQTTLLRDAEARKEFAKNPAAFLNKHNVPIPAGTLVPKAIKLSELEKTVAEINAKLKERGIDIAKLEKSDAASLSKFIHDATQPRVAQESLDNIKQVVSEYNARIASGERPGDAATALAIGAVVVAVVATPVKVYSVDIDVEEEF
jgi:hypothetical protein